MRIKLPNAKFTGLFIILALLNIDLHAAPGAETAPPAEPAFGTLVSTEWLEKHMNDPDLVILDCSMLVTQTEEGKMRSVSATDRYQEGHIPNAVFADVINDMSDTESTFDFALPSPTKLAEALGALGVGDESRVVLYDSLGSVTAARLWWLMRWIGFDRAAILDGGFNTWKAEGRPLSTEVPDRPARTLTPNVRPGLIAYQDEVRAAIDNEQVVLIDAMPEAHYRGEMVIYDGVGHIPGAKNIPSFSLLDEAGRYKPMQELAEMLGQPGDQRVITYCGGGVSATSNAFILTRLGFTNVAVYDGSLAEWTQNPENPLEIE